MDARLDAFSPTYAQARAKFLAAAPADAVRQSHAEPATGREGEALAMDVLRIGADEAPALLLISSGCHGVEGHAGSAAQVDLLRDADFRAQAQAAGVALLFVHALNPWGFSQGRRVTREGVDLNRNFVDFRQPRPHNPGYETLAAALVPPQWPPSEADERVLRTYIADQGAAAFQQAVSGGQYTHADGLFYGGAAPTWSQDTLRQVLRQHATRCRHLAWIDLHTGLGEPGRGERIFAARDDEATRHRVRAWWGPHVTFIEDGTSSSAPLLGNAWQVVYDECPQAAYGGIALEFGTRPMDTVLQALRLDHWVARQAPASPAQRADAHAAMQAAFNPDSLDWRHAVLEQSREAARLAVAGLAAWSA